MISILQYDQEAHEGIDADRVNGIDGKGKALLFQTEQKDRDIQEQQEQRELIVIGRDLIQQHGRPRNAAVIQLDGVQEDRHAESIDDARDGQKEEIRGS